MIKEKQIKKIEEIFKQKKIKSNNMFSIVYLFIGIVGIFGTYNLNINLLMFFSVFFGYGLRGIINNFYLLK